MKLSEETKKLIYDILDSKEFKETLYEGLDKETRDELGMFYTPAKVCINMIEMYDTDSFRNKTILDPCCGSGNLLISMLIAGADSDKIFGNEYNKVALELARKRINKVCEILGKPPIKDWQIHQGNALQTKCLTDFSQEYLDNYLVEYIDDLSYAQSSNSWVIENNNVKRKNINSRVEINSLW